MIDKINRYFLQDSGNQTNPQFIDPKVKTLDLKLTENNTNI